MGFEDLADYLHRRYVLDGARLEDLQREFGASYSAVRSDVRRAGINVRRGARAKHALVGAAQAGGA
jgi:hypothetical protein